MTIALLPDRPRAETHVSASRQWWRTDLPTIFRTAFAPAPHLTVSQWADKFRQLAAGYSAEPGRWRTERTPYLREPMDAISDPEVHEMVIMKSAQVGATEGIIGNAIGYYIDQDPSGILVVQPSEEDAKDWSKNKLSPMLEATPRLHGKISDSKSRDSDNTIQSKKFAGGFLKVTGATSPKGLRRTSVRIGLCDEVDGYPESAGPEGDPVTLVKKRLTTFWNRLLILISTPTIKGRSRIEKAFNASDQRRWNVQCPSCGAWQVLKWGGRDAPFGIKWEKTETAEGKVKHLPDTAYYVCEAAGCVIEERQKPEMVMGGRYVAENPDSETPGWHFNALISLFDGARWPTIVREFLAAKDDPELLKAWTNTVLGEPWEEQNRDVNPHELDERRELWLDDEGKPAEVPDGVGFLTAAVDVQGDRLEAAVWGWGVGEECWLISHERIWGDPEQADVWKRLEALRTRAWRHVSGQETRIWATLIDASYLDREVYKYVRPRESAGVMAVLGSDGRTKQPLSRGVRSNRYGVKPWSLSVPGVKDVLFRRIALQKPGPGFIHLCQPTLTGADAEFCAQFGGELPEWKQVGGRSVRTYRKIRRNEAIDLYVYGLSALHTLGPSLLGETAARARKLSERVADVAPPPEPKKKPHPVTVPRRRNWARDY